MINHKVGLIGQILSEIICLEFIKIIPLESPSNVFNILRRIQLCLHPYRTSFNGMVVLPHSSTEQLDQILLTQEFFLPTKILFWLAVQMP